jgi:3-oxoacyl-[acyl-carrier protein] reductase
MQVLKDRSALVTGASRGIGAAIALRLAKLGAHVWVHYGRGAAEAADVVAQIVRDGGRASAVQADLADKHAPFALFDRIGRGERLDILVNNAAVSPYASTADTTPELFDQIATINMRSLFFVTQQALLQMNDGGRIVNISSLVARAVFPGIPAYSSTKGFVEVFTRHLAQEVAPRRITVNAVAPGAIDTRLSPWLHQPGGLDRLAQIQALPGVGQPDHVAGVVAFLAGPDGAWTTGEVIDASGGSKL